MMRSFALLLALALPSAAEPVRSVSDLHERLQSAAPGTLITLAEGRFELPGPLVIPSGVSLKGAGVGKTIVTHEAAFKGNPATLPDPETNAAKFDRSGYLLQCADKGEGIEISELTLTGPGVHGAIFALNNSGLHVHDLRVEDFMYAGIRTYGLRGAKIHDCTFVDAGIRWQKGQPGLTGGTVGGGIFIIWTQDTEIWNNRFLRTKTAKHEHYYGIKGRQGKRLNIHHNTIEVNFSIEFPFENDQDIEIAHNVLHGAISIPKHGGGPVPESGRTFHIHHNLSTSGYAIEFVRNGVEIDHNLFDFDPTQDGGNLISAFGKARAQGPASFHHNRVRNPGRGVMWMKEPYDNLAIHHNHIIATTTATPRTEGLFGFNGESDFTTYGIHDNIVECTGTPRPLLRNDASGSAQIANNELTGITDTQRYANPMSADRRGPGDVAFECGVKGEVKVGGWTVKVLSTKP